MRRKHIPPGRFIVLGFLGIIVLGFFLLLLPVSQRRDGTHPLDLLFSATSAVCVTGLITVDTADTFSVFGRTVIGLLIQAGGLGVCSVSVGFAMLSGRKLGMRERTLAREGMNYASFDGVISLLRAVLLMTLTFELTGAALAFPVFLQEYPPLEALGYSLFHAVSSFNNAGFDLFGGFRSLAGYQGHMVFYLITCALIIFGGLGFPVELELMSRRPLRSFSLHSKLVLSVTAVLLAGGTLVFQLTENISWLDAFFNSVTARTAGFATISMGDLSNAGKFIFIFLMFIGASPGSTGGGVKTTTFFLILMNLFATATNRHPQVFHRRIPQELLHKSLIIVTLSLAVVLLVTFLLCMAEPELEFIDLFFEAVSAFATVGLTTGITPMLGTFSKLVIIVTMFIGRVGPLTIATMWSFRPASDVSFVQEGVTVG